MTCRYYQNFIRIFILEVYIYCELLHNSCLIEISLQLLFIASLIECSSGSSVLKLMVLFIKCYTRYWVSSMRVSVVFVEDWQLKTC